MRIGGIASGIDTDSLIKDMMRAERIPLDRILQKQQTLEWQRDDFRTLNTSLLNFSQKLSSMKYPSTYQSRSVTSSNEGLVTAVAGAGANVGTYTISDVSQLAKAAQLVGGEGIAGKDGNGKNIKVDVNSKLSNFVDADIWDEDGKATFKIGFEGGEMHEFEISKDDSLKSVIDKVNNSDAGVTMFFDDFTNSVSLTSKTTGAKDLKVDGNFLTEGLKLAGDDATKTKGQNAVFKINGITTERESNTFSMNGVTFTLNKTGMGESSQITVNSDSEKTFDNILKFVDEYNKLVDEMQNKMNEERYASYKPLTEEERGQLSDKQIEQWEEKAKSGLLRRDPLLSSALSEMRISIYSKVDNANENSSFSMLSQIGITTSKDYFDGKLVIDEDKLRAAIEEDPEAVENLFIGDGDSKGEKGIIHRLSDDVSSIRNRVRDKAGSAGAANNQFSIGRDIDSIKDQIGRFEMRLQKTEDRYWKQFSAMEAAMQRANDQMSSLLSSLGGGGF